MSIAILFACGALFGHVVTKAVIYKRLWRCFWCGEPINEHGRHIQQRRGQMYAPRFIEPPRNMSDPPPPPRSEAGAA